MELVDLTNNDTTEKKERSFSINFKLYAIKMATSTNVSEAARTLGIDSQRLSKWKQQDLIFNLLFIYT